MTLAEFTALTEACAAMLGALGGSVAAVGTVWNIVISRKGVAVSTDNKAALVMVQSKQDTNRTELQSEIQGVRHDIRNGGGTAIAKAVVEQIKPVLEETGKTITTEVARSNAEVAVALAEKATTWDGVERRVGKADRRGQ